MKRSDTILIISLAVLGVVVLISFITIGSWPRKTVSLPEVAVNKTSPEQSLCRLAPIVTEIGSVQYPVAEEYGHLRGTGMVLTAEDCGESRLSGMSANFSYLLMGGKFSLKSGPSSGLRKVFDSLGAVCSSAEKTENCRQWEINKTSIDYREVLKLRPYINEIESEDCAWCG
jgi:hypothetical protein